MSLNALQTNRRDFELPALCRICSKTVLKARYHLHIMQEPIRGFLRYVLEPGTAFRLEKRSASRKTVSGPL
jgi:hypothetical protein